MHSLQQCSIHRKAEWTPNKKRELYLQNKEKTNLVLKRKNAKLKGQESSRDITANLEMSV